jgi:murein L,D-transpeptidase YcbB/YkuD
MVEGQVDPKLAHVDWRARQRKVDLVKLLEYALESGRMQQVLEGLYPPHEEYRTLVRALARYQELSARGGWPRILPGPIISPGDRSHRVRQLKDLLQMTGDLGMTVTKDSLYDQETVVAVKKFQTRHGLIDDGVIGLNTLVAMNVPVEERIRQIELNLERWRWMPKSFGKRHLRVNVADFNLMVVEDGATALQMAVIVGTQYRKTPVFTAQMTYLEFAPYWTVPPTILREDKLPAIKHNQSYLEEKHYRIISRSDGETFIDPAEVDWREVDAENFPGLLRMEPGPWNPLGRVKFMFPNSFNVYLHDTNESYLFDNNVRSFSSGCIRVEQPDELAYYLLDGLEAARLEELLSASEPEQVPIKPVPVHIQYWTAWVGQEGLVNFRPDVYFRDLDLEVALKNPAYRVMEQLQAGSGKKVAMHE